MTCQTLGQVHSDWVRRVKYIPLKEFVISCSGSGKDSLVVRDIDDKKRKTYTFKVAKVNIINPLADTMPSKVIWSVRLTCNRELKHRRL